MGEVNFTETRKFLDIPAFTPWDKSSPEGIKFRMKYIQFFVDLKSNNRKRTF